LVKHYGIYESQLIISMFHLSWQQSKSCISRRIADDTNVTETAYASGKHEFTPFFFVEFVLSNLLMLSMNCRPYVVLFCPFFFCLRYYLFFFYWLSLKHPQGRDFFYWMYFWSRLYCNVFIYFVSILRKKGIIKCLLTLCIG
jgi:hypothetical protein